jgi:putative NADH-flavin reductase
MTAMRFTVLGASGRIGQHAVAAALANGHEVTVLVRDPVRLGAVAERVRVVTGTVDDADAVDRAVAGADAVISAIGPDGNSPEQVVRLRTGMRATIAAMERHGVRRIVNLSGAGITAPGERKPILDRLVSGVVRRVARHVVAAKQAEYDELAASGLEWIAVRPAIVTDGERSAAYVTGPDALRPGARVSRADVGHLLAAEAERPSHVGHPGLFIRATR